MVGNKNGRVGGNGLAGIEEKIQILHQCEPGTLSRMQIVATQIAALHENGFRYLMKGKTKGLGLTSARIGKQDDFKQRGRGFLGSLISFSRFKSIAVMLISLILPSQSRIPSLLSGFGLIKISKANECIVLFLKLSYLIYATF